MDAARRCELAGFYRDKLLEEVLPFWTRCAVDREYGGFFTCVDRDGTLVDTDKSVWFQGRASWLFGELYNEVERRPEWLALCRHGIDFLDRHGCDPADGRMWFHLARDGRPIRKRRYAFSESFAAIAYGEFAKATGDRRCADKARELFWRFVNHRTEPKFTNTRPMRSLALPMITIVTAQELRDSIGLTGADDIIDRAIRDIRDLHCKPDLRAVVENVGPAGEILDHFDGRLLNPGHAIEGAWFILLEGRRRGDSPLIRLGCDMLDWMWERGWDPEFGGILYFRDLFGKPVQEYWQDMKFWWPHNEAILATLLAHELTGDKRYEEWHRMVHDWSYAHFQDPMHGEWFGYLHRDGTPANTLKGGLWKGPFHYPRQLYLSWRWLA